MQSLIKDLSADNVCKVSVQSAEKNVIRCLRTFWLTEKKPTAQVIIEENKKSDAKFMLL